MAEEYLTIAEAAKEIGLSTSRIRNLIHKKRIQTCPNTGIRDNPKSYNQPKELITRSTLEAFKKEREDRVIHPKCYMRKPVYREAVIEWRKQNPYKTRYACSKELGIVYNTVLKYWNDGQENTDTK